MKPKSLKKMASRAPSVSTYKAVESSFIAPVSFSQRRLWFLQLLDPEQTSYLVPIAWHLAGALDTAAVTEALNRIVERHETMRTSFEVKAGEPVQVIHPYRPFEVTVEDLASLPEPAVAAHERALADASTPFDLAVGPLFRCRVLRLSPDEHILLFTTHHIIFDGWSKAQWIREFTAFYRESVSGEPAQIPDLPIQYGDFAAWQDGHLTGKVLEDHLQFWVNALEGAPSLLELPTDRPRPLLTSHDGAVVPFTIDKELTEDLRRLCKETHSTLFMVLLTAFQILLARCSGQQDVVVGTPIANRERLELESLIGFFSNTLLMRGKIQTDKSFLDVLAEAKSFALDAYGHQDLPFEKLVEHLQPERSLSYNPLFQVMFALNMPREAATLPGLTISGAPGGRVKTKFDLSVTVADHAEQLRGGFEYSTALFDRSTIDRMIQRFRTLLTAIAASPSTAVGMLPLIGEEEGALLSSFNQTDVELPIGTRVYEFLERRAAENPEQIALECSGVSWSTRQLADYARGLAQLLIEAGLEPGGLVGICVPRSPEMMGAVLAVMKAGGAYVPLDPRHPHERLEMVLGNCGAGILLTMGDLGLKTNAKVLDLALGVRATKDIALPPTPTDDALAYVIYTSGSTGVPKGVAIQHGALMNLLYSMQREPGLRPDDVLVAVTTLAFDIAALELMLPLMTGAKLVIATDDEVQDGQLLLELIERTGATTLQATPATWRMLIYAGWSKSHPLKVLCGGEGLPRELAEMLLDRASEVWNVYGPTETTIWSSATLVARGTEPLRIGPPIANTQFYVLDERKQPVPIGVTGELYIGGKGLARGYWNRPELTAEKFIASPFAEGTQERIYATSDLARWHDDGTVELLGRADFQVKIRGFRIELAEIEVALRTHPDVFDCVTVARKDFGDELRLVAYVAPRAGAAVDASALRSFVQGRLPGYMVPSAFHLLDKLPLNPNGKVDRKALPTPKYEASGSNMSAPATPTEEIVMTIWAEVLRLDEFGAEDDFFVLGGHSLLATQVTARVTQALAVHVPLRTLFESPTVRTFAAAVETLRQAGKTSSLPTLVRVDRHSTLPLSFAQQRFWFLNQLTPNDPGYNVKNAMRLTGSLDAAVLQRALTEIFTRNEVLRTTYEVVDGVPIQVIQPPAPVDLKIVALEDADADEALKRAAVVSLEAFDLRNGPVWRCYLYQIGPEDHVLVLLFHHICMDGTSSAILFQDLATAYSQISAGEAAHLPERSFDYADFASWQRQWMQGPVLEEHLAFWREHLKGLPQTLELPVDHKVQVLSSAGDIRSTTMAPELSRHLKTLCQQQKVTSFGVMLSVLATVLHRWTGQPRFAIGTIAGNRPVAELERVIGCFLNMLPLRMDVSGADRAVDLLARTRATVLDGFLYGQCPFELIVDTMKVERVAHRNPVFNVGLLLQNFADVAFKTDSFEGRPVGFARDTALLDLRFVVSTRDEKIRISCEYKRDLFSAETIDLLLQAYGAALEAVVQDPLLQVDALPFPAALSLQAENARPPRKKTLMFSATFTAEPIEEPLRFWIKALELEYDVAFAPYHQVFQNLLDPSSTLRRNNDGYNILLVRFQDWQQFESQPPAQVKDKIARSVEELVEAVRGAVKETSSAYIVCCCPASHALASDPAWAAFLREMETRIVQELGHSGTAQIITSAEMAELYPVAEYEDKNADAIAHLPYTKEFSTALATMIVRRISSLSRQPYKVVALDCDNTLWSGICGEDGALGVTVGPARLALQTFMRKQREQGMLLCLSSKNNEKDVWEVFRQNPGMLLQRDEITAHRINWQRKAEGLKTLARELGVGLDSFVFIDDNPVECAEMEAECPEVLTLQLPEQIAEIPHFLKHVWAFDHVRSTDIDRRRSDLYKESQQREESRQGQTLDQFIESLQIETTISPLSEDDVVRVAQLTQRTNQFNFTTVRRSDNQVRDLLSSRIMKCVVVNLRDRFGDYGLVGAVIYSCDSTALTVDTFLLSCRALGRRVEHTILDRLYEEARKHGAEHVDIAFSPTAKNIPALEFLEGMEGATKLGGGDSTTYRLCVHEGSNANVNELVNTL